MRIDRAGQEEITRVEELTLRTSQMNATGVHYSDETLRSLLDDPAHEVLVASLTDRFGPHGAIGVLLLEKHALIWHLKLLATSCRVVSFGAGATIISWLTDQAARAGVHLVADFRRTDRNRMMEIAYRFSGFTDDACACTAEIERNANSTVDGPALLHLTPQRQEPSSTIELLAPNLGAPVLS
jgi:methoxymalonate biosynthesis protein